MAPPFHHPSLHGHSTAQTAGTYILGDTCSPGTGPHCAPRCWEQPWVQSVGKCHHGPRGLAPAGLQLWLKPGANTLLLPCGKSPHHRPTAGPEGNSSGFMHFQHRSAFEGLSTAPNGKTSGVKSPAGSNFHLGDKGADEKLQDSWPWWGQPTAALGQGSPRCAGEATQGPQAVLCVLMNVHKVDGNKPTRTGEKMPPSSR